MLLCLVFRTAQAQIENPDEQNLTNSQQTTDLAPQPGDVAGNQEVAEFMRKFSPRGIMSDGSQPTSPKTAVQAFQLDSRLRIELVAGEPDIAQPLFLSWDSQGRLWVVQYRQYQFPAGLKITKYDQHLRAVFDRVPEPPPAGPRGADIITVLSDSDGDGAYDQHRNVIEGLNIATAVQYGRDGIWVLNPPYLLFYPDADGDAVPDASPQVCLSGFGLQDTHSVANSLLFGPDGWLYGSNGSTTTGNISSAVTKGVQFEGQCIWRYHPDSQEFEVYAEGGGNTFSLEIDSYGRVFSGTNYGNTRGLYYPQGSYSVKNWGKHGPLTNPYAYGFFEHLQSQGDDRRFPQAFCIYEGGLLPNDFHGTIIAPNSLHNLVWNAELIPDGSTFRTQDRANLLETPDRWFRPVYAGVGPEGALYLADWYDTRLSHVSPLDDWHKSSGRVYRIVPADHPMPYKFADLTQLSSQQLVEQLSTSRNKWTRQRSVLELVWRADLSVVSPLVDLVDHDQSLEALWVLNGLGELNTERSERWLSSPNPHVRRWVVRLRGDRHEGLEKMVQLAKSELDSEVRSQLAASAKRFEAGLGTRILAELLLRDEDAQDLHLPLMIWWGLERHADNWDAIRQVLRSPAIWRANIMRRHIAARLMQRYATAASASPQTDLGTDWQRCDELVQLADDPESKRALVMGLLRAFDGRALPTVPSALQAALDEYQSALGRSGLIVGIRQGNQHSLQESLKVLGNDQDDLSLRLQVAKLLGEQRWKEAQTTLVRIACGNAESSLQRAALASLQNFDDPAIAGQLVARMDSSISEEHGLRDTACRTLASRAPWAQVLLQEIVQWRLSPQKVPPDVVQQLRSYQDEGIRRLVEKAFGKPIKLTSEEKIADMKRLKELLASQSGDSVAGKEVYLTRCANCHRLFGEGKFVGPALDTYERKNVDFWLLNLVDPSAEIREGFQSFTVLTVDGSVLTGVLESRDSAQVVLRTADDHRITVQVRDIEQLQPLPTSLMPNDLLKELTDQQICDLLAYLSF